MSATAAIVGGGPAGLMAAEVLAAAGAKVTVYDAKPSMGRKFLMAGKSGLNLTMDKATAELLPHYYEASEPLRPMIEAFDAGAIQAWARGLEQTVFTGSSGRVFPDAMKASPLLRAWFSRLDGLGVQRVTRAAWRGWDGGGAPVFDPPQEAQGIAPDITIFALGGASWGRLGSDGIWAGVFRENDIPMTAFRASNVGVELDWSPYMARHFGAPLKSVGWSVGEVHSRGEAVISQQGLEGGGLYPLARWLGGAAALTVDLRPDLSLAQIMQKLEKPRGKASLSNHLRKTLKLSAPKIALLQEWARPLLTDPQTLAQAIKALPVPYRGLRPMAQAISTAGGVAWRALDGDLMLKARPGTYCVGEMVDWDAPTGGYLLTACLATGRWAGLAAARRLGLSGS